MTPRSSRKVFATVVPLLVLGGCGVFGDDGGSLSRVEELINRIEKVHVEAELGKERARTAVETLRALVSPDFVGDPVGGHVQLEDSIAASERQAEAMRESIHAMKAAAEPVFQEWNENLLQFSNAALRQRSQERLEQSRARYHALLAAVEPAQSTYDALNIGLRDVSLFLGHDFNTTAVAEIRDEVAGIEVQQAELDRRLDACLNAALAYVESAGLSARAEPETARPEPAPQPAPEPMR